MGRKHFIGFEMVVGVWVECEIKLTRRRGESTVRISSMTNRYDFMCGGFGFEKRERAKESMWLELRAIIFNGCF